MSSTGFGAARWSRPVLSSATQQIGRTNTRGNDVALTQQTMTDEQRKSVAIEYLKAFDRGGVTLDGGSILELFADDAQVYFPKWGVATGKDQIGRMFGDIGGTLKSIEHH